MTSIRYSITYMPDEGYTIYDNQTGCEIDGGYTWDEAHEAIDRFEASDADDYDYDAGYDAACSAADRRYQASREVL